MFLYPCIFTPGENFGVVLGRAVEEVVAFGNNADADDISAKRDVPEPTFFRVVGDEAFVETRVSTGTLEVSPESDFVELGVTIHPAFADGGVSPGGVDDEGCTQFKAAIFAFHADARDAPIVIMEGLGLGFFHDLRPFSRALSSIMVSKSARQTCHVVEEG